jgi:hypothetical protein
MHSPLPWQHETRMKDESHFLFFAFYALKWSRRVVKMWKAERPLVVLIFLLIFLWHSAGPGISKDFLMALLIN